MTVGFGITPNLLTLLRWEFPGGSFPMKKALAGLGDFTLTAGGDFHPALRTSGARMSNLTEIMACRRHPGKVHRHGETACPHADGTGRRRVLVCVQVPNIDL
jgi:hypothetical protein